MTGWCVTQLPEGLARHIHVEPNTGCWLYAGRKSGRRGEYGRAYFEGKDMQAHNAVLKFFCLEVPDKGCPDTHTMRRLFSPIGPRCFAIFSRVVIANRCPG